MKLPKVEVTTLGGGRYRVTVNGASLPNVSAITYEDVGSPFPCVVVTMIAELHQDGQPLEAVSDYAPWRDPPGGQQ